MKILFIAPLPLSPSDKVSGQSKAAKVLYDQLVLENHQVNVINLNKASLDSGKVSANRVILILKLLQKAFKNRKGHDLIYLSLAESFAGNMRDLVFYKIFQNNLDKVFIHMLGGAGMKDILSKNNLQKKLNANFMKKLAGVIVEGQVNADMFSQVMPQKKIHIVPNFAEDELFVSDEELAAKFQSLDKVNVLYLSNLLPGKGYQELVDAYLRLTPVEQEQLSLTFVGGFASTEDEKDFLNKISNNQGITYLGKYIGGNAKRETYLKHQIFCLPTYYPFEGQPISILEGYATGCAVITSNHSGIPYIFKDKLNGFMVEKKSVDSLVQALRKAITEKSTLEEMAIHNRNEALTNYRTKTYTDKIIKIFQN
ncbi:glycosyltransferase family 4 protein [Pedobacter sp. HDW13]|uniref:glycosyltransferase family 4 protein n=1 Tax=Pedobacter sp. HDW13 TaxID=2714940 RepID=UPI00140AE625|nr:glycosyltransferase family 4 protein [Pedobacter sp. HDW13]QIL39210.1 glycosyltransferase family 4 protein [Pedobacter sp. HDW13]